MILGIDIGGSHIKSALVDKDYKLLDKRSIDTHHKTNSKDFINLIADIIKSYTLENEFSIVGIGYPASIDNNKKIFDTPNIDGLSEISLVEELNEQTGKKIDIINDANAAAIAELNLGIGKNLDNFLMFTLGTGIGGAIVINKNLFKGDYGTAGEFGHSLANLNSEKVKLFENLFSKSSIIEISKKNSILFPNSIFNDIDEYTPKELSDAVNIGDDLSILTLSEAGQILGRGIASIINITGITNVIIGGGLSKLNSVLFNKAEEELNRNLIKAIKGKTKLHFSTYENDSGIIGAAINARKAYEA